MDLDKYVDELRGQLVVAASAGGDQARELAERLTAALDAATRLAMLELLSDAAREITVDLAPGSVEVRLQGRDPELVVTAAPLPPASPPDDRDVASTPSISPSPEEGGTARISLRLPESLKARIEDAANRESLSVNTWLVRALSTATATPARTSAGSAPDQGRGTSVGSRFTGWAR